MKNLIKYFSLCLLAIALVNCGGKKGGSAPAPAPPGDVAVDANQIDFEDGDNKITWSQSNNNVYIDRGNGCYDGLGDDADNSGVQDFYGQLETLMNESLVMKGSQKSASADSVYLNVRYKDGSSKRYNLTGEMAASSEETLSNGDKIIELFDEANSNIQSHGKYGCYSGK